MQACLSERTLDPTLVPIEFATSFAPIPKARMKETMNPTTTTTVTGSTILIRFLGIVSVTVAVHRIFYSFYCSNIEFGGGKLYVSVY